MLTKNEITSEGYYAWDTSVTEPKIGCNLYRILSKDSNGLLTVESLDGCVIMNCGSHCLITAERAMKRLSILKNINPPEDDSHGKWSYDREKKYLEAFESAFNTYEKPVREVS